MDMLRIHSCGRNLKLSPILLLLLRSFLNLDLWRDHSKEFIALGSWPDIRWYDFFTLLLILEDQQMGWTFGASVPVWLPLSYWNMWRFFSIGGNVFFATFILVRGYTLDLNMHYVYWWGHWHIYSCMFHWNVIYTDLQFLTLYRKWIFTFVTTCCLIQSLITEAKRHDSNILLSDIFGH